MWKYGFTWNLSSTCENSYFTCKTFHGICSHVCSTDVRVAAAVRPVSAVWTAFCCCPLCDTTLCEGYTFWVAMNIWQMWALTCHPSNDVAVLCVNLDEGEG